MSQADDAMGDQAGDHAGGRAEATLRIRAVDVLSAGRLDAALCLQAVQGLLAADGLRLISVTLDMGVEDPSPDAEIEIEAQTDKQTRTVGFVRATARVGDRRLFGAQGLGVLG
ncbi:MAG: hypothetical protein R3C52_07380 [Hyphomonadaceae bacterium]